MDFICLVSERSFDKSHSRFSYICENLQESVRLSTAFFTKFCSAYGILAHENLIEKRASLCRNQYTHVDISL